jgi:hypothetical protein
MATEAQLNANRRNAERSTGPRTPAGQARVATNAIAFGLFAASNFVEAGEEAEYTTFVETLRKQLEPEGPIEETFAIEVVAAAWRLRRCGIIESNLLESDNPDATQTAIDRARNQAHRLFVKGIAELRRLQTERQLRFELLPKSEDAALISFRDIIRDLATHTSTQLVKRRLEGIETIEKVLDQATAPDPNWVCSVNPTGHAASAALDQSDTPRNAPCPCKSGDKYKRCCGRNAPPVLSKVA